MRAPSSILCWARVVSAPRRSGLQGFTGRGGCRHARWRRDRFLFGGFAALDLARLGVPVPAVASFHGLLTTAMSAKRVWKRARCGLHRYPGSLGACRRGHRFQEDMSQVDVDWQISIYGNALPSFTNKDVG